MEVEVRGYSSGVLSDGLYVVKADITIFHRLANLRGGTIEFQLDLQLLEPIYLRNQPCPWGDPLSVLTPLGWWGPFRPWACSVGPGQVPSPGRAFGGDHNLRHFVFVAGT